MKPMCPFGRKQFGFVLFGWLMIIDCWNVIEAQSFSKICSLVGNPMLEIGKYNVSGEIIYQPLLAPQDKAANFTTTTEPNRGHSLLRRLSDKQSDALVIVNSKNNNNNLLSSSTRRRRNQEIDITIETPSSMELLETVLVRQCLCGDQQVLSTTTSSHFCPIEMNVCALPKEDGVTACLKRSNRRNFARGAWIFLIVMSLTTLVLIIATPRGRPVLDCMIQMMYPKWDDYIADRILRNHPQRATDMVQEHVRRQQLLMERLFLQRRLQQQQQPQQQQQQRRTQQQQDPLPKALELKTQVYCSTWSSSTSQMEQDDDDAESTLSDSSTQKESQQQDTTDKEEQQPPITCCICFADIQHGERIGELKCRHLFHVDCLKTWLPRRNVCPLCQDDQVATPRYH